MLSQIGSSQSKFKTPDDVINFFNSSENINPQDLTDFLISPAGKEFLQSSAWEDFLKSEAGQQFLKSERWTDFIKSKEWQAFITAVDKRGERFLKSLKFPQQKEVLHLGLAGAQVLPLSFFKRRVKERSYIMLRDAFCITPPEHINPDEVLPVTQKEFWSEFFGWPPPQSSILRWIFSPIIMPIVTIISLLHLSVLVPYIFEVGFKFLSQVASRGAQVCSRRAEKSEHFSRRLGWKALQYSCLGGQYLCTGLKWIARLSKWLVWSWVDPQKNWEHASNIKNKWLRRFAKAGAVVVSTVSFTLFGIFLTPLLLTAAKGFIAAHIPALAGPTNAVVTFLSTHTHTVVQWLTKVAQNVAYAGCVIFIAEVIASPELRKQIGSGILGVGAAVKKWWLMGFAAVKKTFSNFLSKVRNWRSSEASIMSHLLRKSDEGAETTSLLSSSSEEVSSKKVQGTREQLFKLAPLSSPKKSEKRLSKSKPSEPSGPEHEPKQTSDSQSLHKSS